MTQQVITKKMAQQAAAAPGGAAVVQPDPFQDRLLKLIPAEVVTVYTAVFQILKTAKIEEWVYWLVFALLLIANILYKKQAGVKDWRQLLISSVAYVLWVLSIGGPIPDFHIGKQDAVILSSILVPIYTLFVPVIYQ
jgi:hypothetical protein